MPDAEIKPDALAKCTDPVEEIIPNGLGGERAVTRAADGKFQRRITSAMQRSMKESAKFLEGTDPDTGLQRADAIRQSIYENILQAGPKDAMGAVKGAQFLENSAFGKSKETLADARKDNSIKIVILSQPSGLATAEPHAPTPNTPTFAEVLDCKTNVPDPTIAFRHVAEKPKPELVEDPVDAVGNRIAQAQAQRKFDRSANSRRKAEYR